MLTALLLAAAVPPLGADALAQLRDGRIIVESEDGGTAGSTHAWALARCRPEAVWAVITDHAHFPDFVPHLERMEILQHSESAERALQTVDAVVATVRYALDYRFDKERLHIDYQLAPDLPHDIAAAHGAWQLWPTADGTLIEYSSAIDTGRSVPGFIRSYLARSAAGDLLEAVRTRAQRQPVAPPSCDDCARWNETQPPLRIFGNTWYVGVHGLSAVLITSELGHVLIDGDLPESAPKIAASIQALGFRLQDVKLILNSHAHFDHAGGISELQRLTGARVAASKPSAEVLRRGESGPDDPQYGRLPPFPKVSAVSELEDGETLRVGPVAVTARFTPGHTPGGTSWTWSSCEEARCVSFIYADSLTPLSAPGFKFKRALPEFEKSFAALAALPCDVLLTPHPDASAFWRRMEKHEPIDGQACAQYLEAARAALRKRLLEE